MMREIDVRVQSGHAKAPPRRKLYVLTITMDTSLNFDGMCPGVFMAYLTNQRGQRICFPRR
jgi:hypothetical protein